MDFSSLRTLQSEDEYQAALLAVRPFFETEPSEGSLDAARFDALVLLIEEYEKRVYPIPRAEPVDHDREPARGVGDPSARVFLRHARGERVEDRGVARAHGAHGWLPSALASNGSA